MFSSIISSLKLLEYLWFILPTYQARLLFVSAGVRKSDLNSFHGCTLNVADVVVYLTIITWRNFPSQKSLHYFASSLPIPIFPRVPLSTFPSLTTAISCSTRSSSYRRSSSFLWRAYDPTKQFVFNSLKQLYLSRCRHFGSHRLNSTINSAFSGDMFRGSRMA